MFDAALDAAEKALGKLDGVIVTAGFFNTQDKLEQDPAFLARLMTVNYTNTVALLRERAQTNDCRRRRDCSASFRP